MEQNLNSIIEGFRELSTSSVSDAVDRVIGMRGYMSHDIKPIFETKLVGVAATVLTEPSLQVAAPRLALELIDDVAPGTVIVISVGGERQEVAAWGGVMALAAQMRQLAGVVTDGATRDCKEISRLGFPVFAAGNTPAASFGRFANVASQVPITCGGVHVEPGDIIVGDCDGVVVVPHTRAAEVLAFAQQLAKDENQIADQVRALGSVIKALEKLGRI